MKFAIIGLRLVFLFSIIVGYNSCKGQEQKPSDKEIESTAKWLSGDTVSTIEGEIRGITQDAKGNVWFASNGKGLYKYDGETIINFTEKTRPEQQLCLDGKGRKRRKYLVQNARPCKSDGCHLFLQRLCIQNDSTRHKSENL